MCWGMFVHSQAINAAWPARGLVLLMDFSSSTKKKMLSGTASSLVVALFLSCFIYFILLIFLLFWFQELQLIILSKMFGDPTLKQNGECTVFSWKRLPYSQCLCQAFGKLTHLISFNDSSMNRWHVVLICHQTYGCMAVGLGALRPVL